MYVVSIYADPHIINKCNRKMGVYEITLEEYWERREEG